MGVIVSISKLIFFSIYSSHAATPPELLSGILSG